ncbi:MAG: RHS repeat protein, partial [Fidelibacterota bacterium]
SIVRSLPWFLGLVALVLYVLGAFLVEPSSGRIPKVQSERAGYSGPVKLVTIEEVVIDTVGDEQRPARSERIMFDREGKRTRFKRDTIRSVDRLPHDLNTLGEDAALQIPHPVDTFGFRLILPEPGDGMRARVLFRYPLNPLRHERFIYDNDGSLKRRYVHSQNTVGDYTDWTRYTPGGRLDGRDITRYNERGDYLEKKRYGPEGSFEFHWTCKYDDHGNLIEMTSLDEAGAPKQKIVYVYTYDEWGNWTERTLLRYASTGDVESTFFPKIVTRRTIAYY